MERIGTMYYTVSRGWLHDKFWDTLIYPVFDPISNYDLRSFKTFGYSKQKPLYFFRSETKNGDKFFVRVIEISKLKKGHISYYEALSTMKRFKEIDNWSYLKAMQKIGELLGSQEDNDNDTPPFEFNDLVYDFQIIDLDDSTNN